MPSAGTRGSANREPGPSLRPTHSPNDATLDGLMAAYQAGEPAAFEALYRALAPQLHRHFVSLGSGAAQADDLVQEAFLRIHKARRSYDPGLPLRPWAFAIARYVFLMDRRARARRLRREVPVAAQAREPEAGPHSEAILARRHLRQALARLPRERRLPLVLHHLLGLDFGEIGRRLGLTAGAARVRASRALAELRQRRGEQEP